MNNDITDNFKKDYNGPYSFLDFESFLSGLNRDEKRKSIHQLFLIIVCD